MLPALLQMTLVIACGVAWRSLRPAGIAPEVLRHGLTTAVYYLFLPALVLEVLWHAPLGGDMLRIMLAANCGLLVTLAVAAVLLQRCRLDGPSRGALLLAAAFPNATYLGLPVLQATFGDWASSIAIQFDLFACTPLLLTLGVVTARHFGNANTGSEHILAALLRVPPLWAAVLAVTLNLAGIAMPAFLAGWLDLLAAAVVPLMLLSLGLGLSWGHLRPRDGLPLVIVTVLQLGLMPVVVLAIARLGGLTGENLAATVLEGAMPSMVLGIVLCDRYGLRTPLFATAVTVTTLLSLVTLPAWHAMLGT